MASNSQIYNHGMSLDPQSKKVQCNYCGKVVSGFGRLQTHLGGTTAASCREVPSDVKATFRVSSSQERGRAAAPRASSTCSSQERGRAAAPRASSTSSLQAEGRTAAPRVSSTSSSQELGRGAACEVSRPPFSSATSSQEVGVGQAAAAPQLRQPPIFSPMFSSASSSQDVGQAAAAPQVLLPPTISRSTSSSQYMGTTAAVPQFPTTFSGCTTPLRTYSGVHIGVSSSTPSCARNPGLVIGGSTSSLTPPSQKSTNTDSRAAIGRTDSRAAIGGAASSAAPWMGRLIQTNNTSQQLHTNSRAEIGAASSAAPWMGSIHSNSSPLLNNDSRAEIGAATSSAPWLARIQNTANQLNSIAEPWRVTSTPAAKPEVEPLVSNAPAAAAAESSRKRTHFDASTSGIHHQSTTSGNPSNSFDAGSIKQCIAKFIFEHGVDFTAVESYSFRMMLESVSCSTRIRAHIPTVYELNGALLQDEVGEIREYARLVRKSWMYTGCTIVMDVWSDDRGRKFINFIADCPYGPVYVRSADVTGFNDDVGAWVGLMSCVIEEVGTEYVVQVICHAKSKLMGVVGELVMEKYKRLFWTVSLTHCVSLILDGIAKLEQVERVLEKAKGLTRFIYRLSSTRKMMRRFISGNELVKSSKIRSVGTFLTLENILIEKRNLEEMFGSAEWISSPLASELEGKRISSLVSDRSFWTNLITAVKGSIPLIKALSLLMNNGKPTMGLIYETMDQIKETISEEIGKKSQYQSVWNVIDGVWNTVLHSPLHAAGYFLNPNLHYTEDFTSDAEVSEGLLRTVVRMVDQERQRLVTEQMEAYTKCQGGFKTGVEFDRHKDGNPGAWWFHYGKHCPELQRLAVKVLSQTCIGAESYGLKRHYIEDLLTKMRRFPDQQGKLQELAYVHCNLQLQQCRNGARYVSLESDDIHLMDEWVPSDEMARADDRTEAGPSSAGRRRVGESSGSGPKVEER